MSDENQLGLPLSLPYLPIPSCNSLMLIGGHRLISPLRSISHLSVRTLASTVVGSPARPRPSFMADRYSRLESPSPPSPSQSLFPANKANMTTAASLKGSGPSPPASTHDFIKFVDASPDPFHAVKTSAAMLEAAGFKKLKEHEHWDHHLQRGGKYYYTRNQSALVAFAVGEKFTPGDGGVHVVGGE